MSAAFPAAPAEAYAGSVWLKVGIYYGGSARDESNIYCPDGFIYCIGGRSGWTQRMDLSDYTSLTAVPKGSHVEVYSGDELVISSMDSSGVLMSAAPAEDSKIITIDGDRYRDGVSYLASGGKLTVINYVGLEHYLWSVVGAEIGPTYPIEAIKAQAIAARSFAIANEHRHSGQGFNLCDSTDCQAYKGLNREYSSTISACEQTEGEVITYGGRVVNAYYYASSSGETMNSEDVWVSALGYARGVHDEFASGYEWESSMTISELYSRMKSRYPGYGEIISVEVADTAENGAVRQLLIETTTGPLYVSKGATFEEALDYAVSGCTEARMPNRDTYTSGGAYINFAAAVEMVLRNGRMKKYGDQVLGVETGDPRDFTTWEEFFEAYKKQHYLFLRAAFVQQYLINKIRATHFAQPMGSAMHDLCMKHCVDLHQEQVPEGINFGYFEFMGLGTVVDSLAAVKKLVFEEKKLTMDKLIQAIDANFEGFEDVKALLKSAPCYGNNDDYADEIGRELDRISVAYAGKYGMKDLGIHNDCRYVPFTSHVPFGKVVSATPNGRVNWFPLSDGSSASHGADVNGPTAVLLSNFHTKNYGMRDRAARMLNLKFTPKTLEGEQGTEKLVAFIRTFIDLKLWHVQFNVINKETLLKAQKDPAKYRNLIVRIAGYSAYFVDLSPDLQNDLIARTEHETI